MWRCLYHSGTNLIANKDAFFEKIVICKITIRQRSCIVFWKWFLLRKNMRFLNSSIFIFLGQFKDFFSFLRSPDILDL